MDELTGLVEEIADKVVDENKKLKDRIKNLEESDKLTETQNTLEDNIATLEGKFQGNKLETTEQIQSIKEQIDLLKEKVLNEEDIENLIEQKTDTTNLYNKIPIKVNKIEQIKKRDELEKKLAQINNDLMQIRLRLKGNI